MITQRHRKAKLYVKESAEVLWESHTLGMHKWAQVISSIMIKVKMAKISICEYENNSKQFAIWYWKLGKFNQNQFTDV